MTPSSMSGRGRRTAKGATTPPAPGAADTTQGRSAAGHVLDRLTFVTGNAGKVRELQHLLSPLGIEVVQDARGYPEIQADTLEAVAAAGVDALLEQGLAPPFVLEDAGLWIGALRGFPGVYSRYALDTIGCAGILRLMRDLEPEMRAATFRAHIRYVDARGVQHGFDGACRGRIAERAAGAGGFGFDPIFIPEQETRTFAELSDGEKAARSHRGAAARALAAHLSGPASH